MDNTAVSLRLYRKKGALPILGDVLRARSDILGLLAECAQSRADVVELDLCTRSAFVLLHPGVIRDVLVADNDAWLRQGNLETRAIAAFLGRGVLTTDGDAWLQYKRLNAPAFRRRRHASSSCAA